MAYIKGFQGIDASLTLETDLVSVLIRIRYLSLVTRFSEGKSSRQSKALRESQTGWFHRGVSNEALAFDGSLNSNVFQLLRGPLLPKKPRLIW